MAAGRAAEFEDLYERHSRAAWALVYARWLDAELARDAVQEAFFRLWRAWDAGERIDNPAGWVLRVARNLADDMMKSAFHRHGTRAPESLNGVVSHEPAPLDRLERAETFARLRNHLQNLPENDRAILTLRYAFDYDSQRIAEELGIQPSAVLMRLSRARQRLAEILIEHGVIARP
jgi:RNA polymerase sigma-70 factor (ECF subfamily)